MFASLAHLAYRRRWYVVGLWLVLLAVGLAGASQVNKVLGPGDFSKKGSDAATASAILARTFHQNDQQTVVVVVRDPAATAGTPAFARVIGAEMHRIAGDRALHVTAIENPLLAHDPQIISRDRHAAIITAMCRLSEPQIEGQIYHLRSLLRLSGITTYVIGTPAVNHDYAVASKQDLSNAETLAVPLLIIILLLVFGTVAAAALPLLVAGFSIPLALAGVYVVAHSLSTSIYVTNVVTFLGLGIAIDYSLFLVYRFREELHLAENDVEAALVRTMATTGRAVFFSGLTVATGLASLILTGLSFMQSMGIGGILVPITSLLVTLTLLPAVLSILGPRVNRLRVLPVRFLRPGSEGPWHRLATAIMHRPLLSGGAVLVLMLALAYPATQLAFSFGTLKNAPQVASVTGLEYVQSHFNTTSDPTLLVIQRRAPGTLVTQRADFARLEAQLRRDPEVKSVSGPAEFLGNPVALHLVTGRVISPDLRTAIVTVIPRHEVGTRQAEQLVERLASQLKPGQRHLLPGDAVYVGGAQATYTSFNIAMYDKFPLIIVLVLALSYLFLFLAFRSVFLPLKAVLLNLLSVSASYGVLQLVFQRGVGHQVLGFSPESGVASWVPIFLFAFLFGLSMDYEVFLLSRIREHWLATRNNRASVAYGLERTGRLITSAAVIMVLAFSGLIMGHEIQLKEFGLGMVASVALDASLIRIVLVPSIMAIMGEWNWWLPPFLRRFGGRPVPLMVEEPEPLPARA